jgi:hypothetical protein
MPGAGTLGAVCECCYSCSDELSVDRNGRPQKLGLPVQNWLAFSSVHLLMLLISPGRLSESFTYNELFNLFQYR